MRNADPACGASRLPTACSDGRMSMTIPESLCHSELEVIWTAARDRLDRFGVDRRGTIAVPELGAESLLALQSLLGRRPGTRLDLAVMEHRLIAIGVGADLDESLTSLGFPPSTGVAARREAARRRDDIRELVRRVTSTWREPWAEEWAEWTLRTGQFAGMDRETVGLLVDRVRRILDEVDVAASDGRPLARTELAVRIVGTAHGLDDGVPLERCVRRALRHRLGPEAVEFEDAPTGRNAWQEAGIATDGVSAPVLTWRLPFDPATRLGAITAAATAAAVPIHLSTVALRTTSVTSAVVGRSPVLLVENPRLVEAAAERSTPWPVIATNGNPASAVTSLVDGLISAGVEVRAHSDFDSAGIGICRRLRDRGCVPWRMDGRDYSDAVDAAVAAGIELPTDTATSGPTEWDPSLAIEFNARRCVVHEEFLVDRLLDPSTW